ncbi:MAG: hypothetical protein N4A38_00395 [Candidatus Gracilibacteria bacterium]|nr:hypothetical protein [Candidatus Gracilibacteria bacterium]
MTIDGSEGLDHIEGVNGVNGVIGATKTPEEVAQKMVNTNADAVKYFVELMEDERITPADQVDDELDHFTPSEC